MDEAPTIVVPEDLPEAEARAIYAEHAELARDLCRGDGQVWANLPHSARDHYHAEAWREIAEREGWQN